MIHEGDLCPTRIRRRISSQADPHQGSGGGRRDLEAIAKLSILLKEMEKKRP
jgi:hypothetical protein